jgi:hypothetical protein
MDDDLRSSVPLGCSEVVIGQSEADVVVGCGLPRDVNRILEKSLFGRS